MPASPAQPASDNHYRAIVIAAEVSMYPTSQAFFRAHHPPALIIRGKNDYIRSPDGRSLAAKRRKETSVVTTPPAGLPPFELPAIARPESQPAARLIVAAPLPDALARGLVVLQYRAEHLRFVEVYGPAGLGVVPRIGHVHVSVDDSQWHWVDASGEPIIVQGLAPGAHTVRIDLADPTHHVIDTSTVAFEIPVRPPAAASR